MTKNYVVKEHKANHTLGHLEPETLLKFLNQSIAIVKGLQSYEEEVNELIKDLTDENEGSLAQTSLDSVISDEDIDELLEIMESAEIQNFDAISAFYSNFYSVYDSLNAHVRVTLWIIKEFNTIIKKYADSWTCPSFEDLKNSLSYCNNVMRNLLFIIYYEFDMESVVEPEEDGRFYIDEIYDKYCKQYDLDPEQHTKTINNLRSIYKIRLGIFEEYPDLEEPFEELMGPNMANIDEDKVTLQIVKDVITGKISDTQAYEMIKNDDAEADNTLDQSSINVNDLKGMGLF